METKEAQVIMLPTDKSMLIHHKSDDRILSPLKYPKDVSKKYQLFYLYFINDEEIKEGDWVIVDGHVWKHPIQVIKIDDRGVHFKNILIQPVKDCKKIIATTDPKLYDRVWKGMVDGEDYYEEVHLPQISQSFIESYCKKPVDKVIVEYTGGCCGRCNGIDDECIPNPIKLKLTSNNEIIIHPIEEKLYTREEVESILFNYASEEHAVDSSKQEIEAFNRWVEENL